MSWSTAYPPWFRPTRKAKGARKRGLDYEAAVHAYLRRELGKENYCPNTWFKFYNRGSARPSWCSPDALWFDFENGALTIFEAKLNHRSDSWWQLTQLYQPVVAAYFREWKIKLCAIAAYTTPETPYPVDVYRVPKVQALRQEVINFHLYNPKYDRRK